MNIASKGKSPFYPGQPVPIEFFTGRKSEIIRIARSLNQVEQGKPQAVFLTGEYGIGKSSLASYMRHYAEKEKNILGIHVFLGVAQTVEEVATRTVHSVINAEVYEQSKSEVIRNFLGKYIEQQELFGATINIKALKADGPNLSKGFLPFLKELLRRVEQNGIKGLMLILDEINGITSNPQFAHFIKTLVDENALSSEPLPLLLMLCGVDERRKEMIKNHPPVERIFDIVEIQQMGKEEMKEFYTKSFESAEIKIEPKAMDRMCYYSAGFPKIMHAIGDEIYWIDFDGKIDYDDALNGIRNAAVEIGKKFVDQQVYRALQSKDYRSILEKLCKGSLNLSFMKSDIQENLTVTEKKKFNNFLVRMKKLNVLRSGDERGEYIFNSRIVRLYLFLQFSKAP